MSMHKFRYILGLMIKVVRNDRGYNVLTITKPESRESHETKKKNYLVTNLRCTKITSLIIYSILILRLG